MTQNLILALILSFEHLVHLREVVRALADSALVSGGSIVLLEVRVLAEETHLALG